MTNIHTVLNVLVALLVLGVLAFTVCESAAGFYHEAPAQTLAYTGFGGLVVAIVGVGSALLSPRRY